MFNYGGLLASLLTTLFVGLKLTGYIGWSWIWVLSPVWVTMIFAIFLWIFIFIVAWVSITASEKRRNRIYGSR